MSLRRAGKGYVLGVAGSRHFWSWGDKPPVAGTAEAIAAELPSSAYVRLSAGDDTKGPRFYDWAYLELADLEAEAEGWHVSARLRVPDGLRLVFLPPYSPELQPAEHLWPLAREGIANQHFGTLAELEAKLTARCRVLRNDPGIIKANTLFHWWPQTA